MRIFGYISVYRKSSRHGYRLGHYVDQRSRLLHLYRLEIKAGRHSTIYQKQHVQSSETDANRADEARLDYVCLLTV